MGARVMIANKQTIRDRQTPKQRLLLYTNIDMLYQGTNARKVNCGRVYSAYILKPVLSGRNL